MLDWGQDPGRQNEAIRATKGDENVYFMKEDGRARYNPPGAGYHFVYFHDITNSMQRRIAVFDAVQQKILTFPTGWGNYVRQEYPWVYNALMTDTQFGKLRLP